jgi:hypothetical protein
MRDAADPIVDLRAEHWAADCRRVSHSIHGAGRVGCGAGAFE